MSNKPIEDFSFEEAAYTWFDIDLDNVLSDPSLEGVDSEGLRDRIVIYCLSRMWLCQLMAEYNVEDYYVSIDHLWEERSNL